MTLDAERRRKLADLRRQVKALEAPEPTREGAIAVGGVDVERDGDENGTGHAFSVWHDMGAMQGAPDDTLGEARMRMKLRRGRPLGVVQVAILMTR